jgi:replicative DNA helicase
VKRSVQSASDILHKAIKQIEAAAKTAGEYNGVRSGFTDIDSITLGWQPSDLIIIAARPSMGKTAFVLTMARNMAVELKSPVAFFSLEMSSVQLMNRLIVAETQLKSKDLRTGNLSPAQWAHLEKQTLELGRAPLYIDDTPALSVYEFRSKARRLKTQHDIKIIIIDYLQLMTAASPETRGNREQEVSLISRTLKAIAKELDVPIIALSQLSRNVENRGGSKRPQLSDLRESGAIEQDADVVAFIHRPEYYGLTTNEQGLSTEGMAEIIIAKHRNGEVTDVPLRFVKEQAKFMDADSSITADVLNGGGYSESYDYAASSANSLPPMGSAPADMGGFGGMSGVPSDFDLGPAPTPAKPGDDIAPF